MVNKCKSKCPAVKLAIIRILKAIGRAKILIISMIIKKKHIYIGALKGKKCETLLLNLKNNIGK